MSAIESTVPFRRVPRDEWLAEAARLFGPDPNEWRFVCPVCGHVASVGDFRQYKAAGATPESAVQECIGRYQGAGSPEPGRQPCNYAGYGLFRLSPVRVIAEDGQELHVFEFEGRA